MDLSACIQTTFDGGVLLDIEVQPASRRLGITGFNQWRGRLTVSVTAEAQQGKANEAVKHILAKILGLAKSSIEITSGHSSRAKKIRINDLDLDVIIERINIALEGLS